jgi:tRNA (guanine26-N2/guanine27-N2)-dimethyltransferase
MVTCTDLAVLAGAYPEKCHANYGSFPLKGKHCHEQALRIVLGCMEGHANRHRRYIVPLLSVHGGHFHFGRRALSLWTAGTST